METDGQAALQLFDLKLIDSEEGEYRGMHEASFGYEMGYPDGAQ